MRIDIPFVGPTYNGRSSKENGQRTVNLFPVLEKPGAKTPIALYSTPGLSLLGSAGSGTGRSNGVKFGADLYFVVGAYLVKCTDGFVLSTVGTLSTTSSRCVLAAGRSYLMIVDGTAGYSWDGTTFATISDADFPNGATHCTYLKGFFIVNKPSSDAFYISASEDPTTWAATDFASAESAPDDIDGLVATENDLYLIGSETTQVFYDSGASFPFDPYPNGTFQVGIAAAYSLVQFSGGLIWLASNGEGDTFVAMAQGLSVNPISTVEIDWQISQLGITSDAIGSIYRQDGRTFYVLTFPSSDKTFSFDLTPDGRDWHERKSYGIGRWRVSGIGYLNGKVVACDYDNSRFYELDYSTYDDNGDVIERIRRAQVIHKTNFFMTFWELIVDMEAGVGLTTGQGSDPQVMLRYSDDGAKTWSNELWETAGAIGTYTTRVMWDQLGDSRERIFEIKVTDPVRVTILGAYANIDLGTY